MRGKVRVKLSSRQLRDRDPLEAWAETLDRVRDSTFLCGEEPSRRGQKPFRLSVSKLCQANIWQAARDREWVADEDKPGAESGQGGIPEGVDPKDWAVLDEALRAKIAILRTTSGTGAAGRYAAIKARGLR